MKREKARLDVLQAMPYEQYIQTSEWLETQKAALKRAGNRCQVCRKEVASQAYHTTLDNLGCEQEGDILALCESCYDHLSQKLQQFAEQTAADQTDDPDEEQNVPHFSLFRRGLIFAPSALLIDGLFALLHAPLPAEVFGLGIAIALAANSPKIYAGIRDSLPESWQEYLDGRAARKKERAATGEWSTWDRLLARHINDDVTTPHTQIDETHFANRFEEESDLLDYLDLGPTLRPHADRLLSGRKVILGVSGSGKTNTVNVYIEEIGRLEPAPAIILFDTDDENRAICSKKYWPNPAWMDKERGLTKHTAFKMAHNILEERYQCVINLQSYDDEEAAWIMIYMIKGVRAWQEAREIRVPCEIVLDEASVWLPQNARESSLSSVMVEDPDPQSDEENKKISLLALLQRAFFQTVVRRGRRRGMGFTLAAQRIAEIDKRALQGSWMFLMRQTQPADWREYKEFGITPEEARDLLDGEAYVFAPGSTREKHRLRESRSPHGGVTPGLKALRGSAKGDRRVPNTAGPVVGNVGDEKIAQIKKQPEQAIDPLASTINTLLQLRGQLDEQTLVTLINAAATGRDTGEKTVRHPPLRGESGMRAATPKHSGAGLPLDIQDALAVLTPGMTYRELGAALGYSDGVAREIWKDLKRRGLLRSPSQEKQEISQITQTSLEPKREPAITDLAAYRKSEQRIPSLAEIVEAFPNQLPSKRDIAKRFDITEYQAYELQKQLKAHLEKLAGQLDDRSVKERKVKN